MPDNEILYSPISEGTGLHKPDQKRQHHPDVYFTGPPLPVASRPGNL